MEDCINKFNTCELFIIVFIQLVSFVVLQPNITDITITPIPSNDGSLLYQFNSNVLLTCTAEGGPRIMTRWQFDDGSTVETVANDSSSVTYEISSLSTDHTGVYYCEAIIDVMTDISMNYTLFGEFLYGLIHMYVYVVHECISSKLSHNLTTR